MTGRSALAFLCASASVFSFLQLAAPQENDAEHQAELAQAYDELAGGSIERGIRALRGVLERETDPEEQSHIRYLVARAWQEAGDCERAFAALEELEQQAGADDPWLARASFARAECLISTGDGDSALSVFSTEAESLLEDARRERLVEEVVAFARQSAELSEYGHPINSSQALQLYQLAFDLRPEGPLADEAEHHVAWLASDTARLMGRIRRNPEGPWACSDRLRWGQLTGSATTLWWVVRECNAAVAVPAAVTLDDAWGGYRAIRAMETAISRFPEEEAIPPVKQALAIRLIQLDTEERAWTAVEASLDGPDGIDIPFALEAATAFRYQNRAERARALWRRVHESTARPEFLEQVQRDWAELRRTEVANLWRAGDLDGALELLTRLAEEVPTEASYAQHTRARLLAHGSRWAEAETAFRAAGTNAAILDLVGMLEARGELDRARMLREEHHLSRTEQLSVAVPRSFTTDETAELIVRTEGLEELQIRLHQVDVIDFLRSMGSMSGLADLDVDLIAPDETRTVSLETPTVEGDRTPGPTYGPVELEGLSAGVYAVEVVAETQQTMAVVRVSDIAMVARTVGGDLAVLVVDLRTGRPVPGATVLATDGSRLLEEGETGADGVFEATVSTGPIELMATRGDDVCWTALDPVASQPASEVREALDETEHVWARLDRQQASAGETVSFVAFIAEGQAPRRPKDGSVTVTLESGSEILRAFETPVAAGLVEGQIHLPEDLPDGQYGVTVHDYRLGLQVGRNANLQPRIHLTQDGPAEPGGMAVITATAWAASGELSVSQTLHGDLADGLGHRALGQTDEHG